MARSIGIMLLPSGAPNARTAARPLDPPHSGRSPPLLLACAPSPTNTHSKSPSLAAASEHSRFPVFKQLIERGVFRSNRAAGDRLQGVVINVFDRTGDP